MCACGKNQKKKKKKSNLKLRNEWFLFFPVFAVKTKFQGKEGEAKIVQNGLLRKAKNSDIICLKANAWKQTKNIQTNKNTLKERTKNINKKPRYRYILKIPTPFSNAA